jgi:hypothetical protein
MMANGAAKRISASPGSRICRRYWICLTLLIVVVTIQVIVSLFAVSSVTESDKKNQIFPTQQANKKVSS